MPSSINFELLIDRIQLVYQIMCVCLAYASPIHIIKTFRPMYPIAMQGN